jgi:predicted GNAT family N-acyltransferase
MTAVDGDLILRTVATPPEMAVVVDIRRRVFGNEQRILLPRYQDPEDDFSFNLLAYVDEKAVGTGRLSPIYERATIPTITWVATLPPYRGRGIGTAIVAALVREADERGYEAVFLNSQVHANPLYEAFGFRPLGHAQLIHGIPHQAMIRRSPGGTDVPTPH